MQDIDRVIYVGYHITSLISTWISAITSEKRVDHEELEIV